MAKSVSLLCTISWAYTSLYLQVLWDSSALLPLLANLGLVAGSASPICPCSLPPGVHLPFGQGYFQRKWIQERFLPLPMWTSIVVNVGFFLWISWSLAARKWRVTARHLVFVYREWVNLFHRPKGPLSKGNSAWSAQLPGSTELSCFLSFIIWWSGSHRVFLRSWQLDWFLAISEYWNGDMG